MSKSGDTFPIELEQPVMVDGIVAIPAGTKGQGEVVHAKKTGIGVGGELVLAARWLELGGQRIRLRSMQIGRRGKDNQALTYAVGATLGLPALFIRGKHIEIPAGSPAEAKLATTYAFAAPQQPPAAETADTAKQSSTPTESRANGS